MNILFLANINVLSIRWLVSALSNRQKYKILIEDVAEGTLQEIAAPDFKRSREKLLEVLEACGYEGEPPPTTDDGIVLLSDAERLFYGYLNQLENANRNRDPVGPIIAAMLADKRLELHLDEIEFFSASTSSSAATASLATAPYAAIRVACKRLRRKLGEQAVTHMQALPGFGSF